MPVYLIINADDLGLAPCVNSGIAKAHAEGILTSATLMPNGPAYQGGVEVAKAHPDLGIGIHLNAVRGHPLCEPSRINVLLNDDNRFAYTPWSLGRQARRTEVLDALEIEYRAQIERVLDSGITPTHLDSEKHHAVWKPIQQLLAKLASAYDIPAMRNLKEPAWLAFRHLPRSRLRSVVESALLRTYTQYGSISSEVRRPDFFFGQTHIGEMNEATWLRLIPILPDGINEVMVHPAEMNEQDFAKTATTMGPSWIDPGRPFELSALISCAVRESIKEHQIQLVSFAALRPT